MRNASYNALKDLTSALMKTVIVIAIAVPATSVTTAGWRLLTDALDYRDPNEKIICSG